MAEKILLESFSKSKKNQKMFRSSQPGFLKEEFKTVYKTNPNLLNLPLMTCKMEQKASLQNTKKWEKWWVQQTVMPPFRGTSIGEKKN